MYKLCHRDLRCFVRTLLHACREASPGKLGAFEEELFRNVDMTDVPVVAALLLGYSEGARTVGIAFADAAGRRLGACEFADDEYFCATEAVLLQLGAKEVVLPKVRCVSAVFLCCLVSPV